MKSLTFLALLSLASQPGWKEAGKTADANPVYVRTSTVTRTGSIVAATVRTEYLKHKKMKGGDVTSSRTKLKVDCAKESYAVLEHIEYYDAKTNKIFSKLVPTTPGYGPVMGGSMSRVAYDYLCKK